MSATNVARTGKRGNICVGNNVSATMCPRSPGPLLTAEKRLSSKMAIPIKYCRFFPSPKLEKDVYFSVKWPLRILVWAPLWVGENAFIFVVKICWTYGCLPALKNPFVDPKYVIVLLFFDLFRSIFNAVLILITIVVWIVYVAINKHFWTPEPTNNTVINWIKGVSF